MIFKINRIDKLPTNILKCEYWKKNKLSIEVEDSSKKYLEQQASRLHSEIEIINKILSCGKNVIHTFLKGIKEDHYILRVRIIYYSNKKENEYKGNTHRQEINF